MPFKPTKKDLQRSSLCPVGTHLFTVISADDEYLNAKGTTVQKVDFETADGYLIPNWFNDKMGDAILRFVQAADNITFDMNSELPTVNLKDYVGKKVAGAVSHRKDDNGKMQAQIDEFYTADQVPF